MSDHDNQNGQEFWTWEEYPEENRVIIGGEVDFSVSPQVREKLHDFLNRTHGDIVLDLAPLQYIDSSGLAVLIELRNKLKDKNRTIQITEVSPQVEKIFSLTQIGSIFGL
ncbi:STAS domain-containing protein [Desulfovibrio inopinatus]|uniref:STAS domain-containing protein n=1 Tax=Desulfovibrio inopinatus TaxID=102109 RepID=UPI000413B194|nr:STAS domain-containing protein [Desulfovibrio inopinatus]